MYFLLLLLIPKLLFSVELNLLCTNNYSTLKEVDVKDIFLLLDSDTKKIDLGGLSFYADVVAISDSNISWSASNINIYPDSNGEVSGIIGRYSGELVLNFMRYEDDKISSLVFNCRRFELKERKF
jgi:hypothetical protein